MNSINPKLENIVTGEVRVYIKAYWGEYVTTDYENQFFNKSAGIITRFFI